MKRRIAKEPDKATFHLMIRLALADDQLLFRRGLVMLLRDMAGVQVVTRPEMGLRKTATHGGQVQAKQERQVRVEIQ